jgi:hypothetical protein
METEKIGMREFRENLAGYLESGKPLAITRHGETLLPMLADVHVATPQPTKSVSSVQIGQPRARAAARMDQSSGSRVPSRFRASASKSP